MATPFQTEAWTEYGIGIIILFLRIFARCRLVGLDWDGDDYFAVAAVVFWTGELVMLELIGQYGSITGMSNEIALTLSEDQIRRIVIGSKYLLVGWSLYVTLIWCLKACMLFLYNRLTLNLNQQKAVKVTAVACVIAYISTMVVILTHCLPISRLWQVYPYPGDSCALNVPNYLALVVTNVTTDLMILYIPLPLLWRVKIELRRNILFGLWLCTGIFIVVATIVRCVICLGDAESINTGTIWSIRETFVGIIAVNIPVLKPFVSKTVRLKYGLSGPSDKYERESAVSGSHELTRIEKREKQRHIRYAMGLPTIDNSSEERMVPDYDSTPKHGGAAGSSGSIETLGKDPNEIRVTTAYDVSR